MRIMTYPIIALKLDLEGLKEVWGPLFKRLYAKVVEHHIASSILAASLVLSMAMSFYYMSSSKLQDGYTWSNGVATLRGLTGPLPGPLLSFKWPGNIPPIAPWAVKELERKNTLELEELMLSGVPTSLRPKAKLLLPSLLSACERFGVDPFWAMSIMWTESHFRLDAQSYAGAYGPMQIMPATAHYILWKQGERMGARQAARIRKIPSRNVDLGVAYLAELLRTFNGNYKHATIAYNMGPYGLKRALASGRPIGVNHRYWKRVVGHLKLLLDASAPRLGPWRHFNERTLEEFAVKGIRLPLLGMVR